MGKSHRTMAQEERRQGRQCSYLRGAFHHPGYQIGRYRLAHRVNVRLAVAHLHKTEKMTVGVGWVVEGLKDDLPWNAHGRCTDEPL